MKKIININLGGRLIPIDEDAYALLNRYLSELKSYFVEETGGPEILRDMEDRIAELFQERIKKGAASICIEDVESVKQTMGSPEAIHDEAGNEEAFESEKQTFSGARKQLFRSKNEKVISGVCGGLAAYFNIDPLVVRILFAVISLFWGVGFLVYILLWAILPESEARPTTALKRRLYRDEDRKVLGGVCAGLAAYLNIDTVWLRLLFLLPLVFSGFISFLDNDWFSVSIGGLPGTFILYCILWAALPSARSVSEKLQMRGEKVDINSLSAAHKNPENAPVRESSLLRLVKVLFKIMLIGLIAICCIVLLSVLAALFFGSLGMGVSLVAFPFHDLITDNETHQWILFISLAFLIILPVYAFIRAVAYLISAKKNPHPRGLTIGLVLLFLISAGATIFVIGQIAQDFRIRYYTTEQLDLQPITTDTILISQQSGVYREGEGVSHIWEENDWDFGFLNDSLLMLENVSINLEESADSLLHLSIEKVAYGRQLSRARSLARDIDFDFDQKGATLIFPEAIALSAQHPFRGQSVNVTLRVPQGKVIRFISGDTRKSTMEYNFRNGRFRVQHRDEHWEHDRYYHFRNGHLVSTDEQENETRRESASEKETDREQDGTWTQDKEWGQDGAGAQENTDTYRKPPPPPAPGH